MIYLRPVAGLCNRLRAINSAIALARDTCQHLHVYWRLDQEMNTCFHRLFNVPDDFVLNDAGRESFAARIFYSRYNFGYRNFGSVQEWDYKSKIPKVGRPWVITSFSPFYDGMSVGYDWLRPVDAIQLKIDAFRREFGRDMIAMHIRRTDNEMSRKLSPLSLFEEKIKDHLKDNSQQRFFIASDDDAVKNSLREQFGSAIVTRDHVARREDANGVEDAVVDLLLLAECSCLYGSGWSSFSEVAAQIAHIPYLALTTK